MMKKGNRKAKEIVWYVIAGLIAVFGLLTLITGIIGEYVDSVDSFITSIGLGISFQLFGSLMLVLAALVTLITLVVFAKRTDVAREREIKRAQRFNQEE